jgi:hypothetical protein
MPLAPLANTGYAGLAALLTAAKAAATRSAMPASPGSRALGGGAFFAFSDFTWGGRPACRALKNRRLRFVVYDTVFTVVVENHTETTECASFSLRYYDLIAHSVV